MSRTCPQCSQVNPDTTTFCTRCGYNLSGNEPAIADAATTVFRPGNLASVPADADPADTLAPGAQPVQSSASAPLLATPQSQPAPLPATPAYAPVQTPQPPQQGGFFLPPQQGGYPPQQGAYPPQQAYGQALYGQPAPVAGGLTDLQRAFAGKGTPVHHQSWLLENTKEAQAAILRNTLIGNIQRQGVLGLVAGHEHLREKSLALEERDYVKIQYGISSILVYFAPMGPNIYISRTSTVQQVYSRVREFVLLGLAVLWLLSLILFATINPTYDPTNLGGYGFASDLKDIFGYAFYGLLFFFLYVLIRSLISWLTDKDFLAYLRPNQLNDFTLDALTSIELVTDKAIRETVKQAGLNPAEVTPPVQSYGLNQPLRRV